MSTSAETTGAAHDLVIRPPGKWNSLGLRELWAYYELLYFLTKRDLQIRYKQSSVGASWAVLQPLALAFIFALFFGRLAKVPSEGVPYPIFALSALVPWIFASQSVSLASGSLVGDADLLAKVYFPRLVVPIARILSLLIDLAISLVLLLAFVGIYGLSYRPTMVYVPLFVAIGVVTALGAGVFLAALNVKYRDVTVAMPLVMQVWLFATPVIYPGALITGAWKYLYALNPMVSVIDGVRWSLFGTTTPAAGSVAISAASALLMVLVAATYFRRTERYFADVI